MDAPSLDISLSGRVYLSAGGKTLPAAKRGNAVQKARKGDVRQFGGWRCYLRLAGYLGPVGKIRSAGRTRLAGCICPMGRIFLMGCIRPAGYLCPAAASLPGGPFLPGSGMPLPRFSLSVKMAGHLPSFCFLQRRGLLGADLHGMRAACPKRAAAGRVEGRGDVPF